MTVRISGMASGMDVDGMVKELMKAKRVPLDKLTQQKTTIGWQQEQYRDVNVKLVDFRNNKLFNYGLSGSIAAKQVNVTGNTTAISAKASSSAVSGTMKIEVGKLATAASLMSDTVSGPVATNETLASLKTAGKINFDDADQTVTINGKVITFDANADTFASLVSKINSDSTANVNVFLDSTTGKMSITSKSTGSAATVNVSGAVMDVFKLKAASLSGRAAGPVDTSQKLVDLKAAGKINYDTTGQSVTVNGKIITFNENVDTLDSLVAKINGDSTANAIASIDGATGRLTITSKAAGGTVAASGKLLESFKLGVKGEDASVTINGIATTRASNTFTENGVEITLNGLTSGTTASLNVVTNTDKIVDTIKSFIADYNSIMDLVNGKLNEERYSKYAPLTDEQKSGMKDDEIKLWESKAKSGLLRNDTTFSQLVNNQRLSAITSVNVGGTDVNLTSLGISTGDWTSRGKLVVIDENKLRQAIETNPDQVMGFFTQKTTQTDSTKKGLPTNPDNGLFNRLSNNVMAALDGLAQKAGTSKYSSDPGTAFSVTSLLSTQLRDIDSRISQLNNRLNMQETAYYKQFTAMESAINRYNKQSTNLFSAAQ